MANNVLAKHRGSREEEAFSSDIVRVLSMLELETDEEDDEGTPGRCCASSTGSSVGEPEDLFGSSSELLAAKVFAPTGEPKHVTFSTVQVREYTVIVGDHPCCQSGLPMSLDWQFKSVQSVEVDAFEMGKRHRSRYELLTTWEQRKVIYLEDTAELRRKTRTAQRQRCRDNRLIGEAFFSCGSLNESV